MDIKALQLVIDKPQEFAVIRVFFRCMDKNEERSCFAI